MKREQIEKREKREKIVFAGTSEFASIVLGFLENIDLVITKPDAPKGRGLALTPSPVKELALSRNISVLEPVIVDRVAIQSIKDLQPDIIVVVAYGMILPSELIHLPRYGCFNIHSSILPYHKGASPISFSLLNMDSIGGITIIKMDEGMDTGDIVRSSPYPLTKNQSLSELHDELAKLGGMVMKSFLADLTNHQHFSSYRQDKFLTTMCAKFEGKNAWLDFNDSADKIHNQILAVSMWKNFKFKLAELELIVKRTVNLPTQHNKPAGDILEMSKDKLVIACAKGALQILQLQLAGKKPTSWSEFYSGNQNKL